MKIHGFEKGEEYFGTDTVEAREIKVTETTSRAQLKLANINSQWHQFLSCVMISNSAHIWGVRFENSGEDESPLKWGN